MIIINFKHRTTVMKWGITYPVRAESTILDLPEREDFHRKNGYIPYAEIANPTLDEYESLIAKHCIFSKRNVNNHGRDLPIFTKEIKDGRVCVSFYNQSNIILDLGNYFNIPNNLLDSYNSFINLIDEHFKHGTHLVFYRKVLTDTELSSTQWIVSRTGVPKHTQYTKS